ncbi:MAG: PTS sugar transporter subunit IIA [Planctomycetota bacterium]|nr:PTS sugar transporter subunit IIA [Planctomycetota bacterium]
MRLEPVLHPELVLTPTDLGSMEAVLTHLSNHSAPMFPALQAGRLLEGFLAREAAYPTCTPEGVAFPHVLLPEIDATRVAALRLRPGVRWATSSPSHAGHPPQDLVFAIFGNSDTPWEHVRLLARLARISQGQGALARLRAAENPQQLHATLVAEDRRYG